MPFYWRAVGLVFSNFKYSLDTETDLVAKGNDAIIKNVYDELGLAASLNAIYSPGGDPKVKILASSIVDFGRIEVDGELTLHILLGGEEEIRCLTDHLVEVLWVTPLTATSVFSTAYAAYGNETHLLHNLTRRSDRRPTKSIKIISMVVNIAIQKISLGDF